MWDIRSLDTAALTLDVTFNQLDTPTTTQVVNNIKS